jgi:hypothetical protein
MKLLRRHARTIVLNNQDVIILIIGDRNLDLCGTCVPSVGNQFG